MTKIIDVEITTNPDGTHTITPVWSNVDRPRSFSWGVKATHRKLAERLKRAILAGAVFTNVEIKRDVYGKTYASYSCNVLGRMMNADLKRLGF